MNTFKKTFKFFVVAFLFLATSLILFACVKNFKITFDFDGGTWNGKTQEVLTYKKGTTIPSSDIPSPTKDNFEFDGWLKGSEKVKVVDYKVESNETFKASWKTKQVAEEKYQVLVNEEIAQYFKFENGFLVGQKVNKGTKVTFTLQNIPNNKKVVAVTQNGTKLEPNAENKYELTLNADTTLALTFEEANKTVTVQEAYRDYIEFDGYTAGQGLFKGDKVVFKVKDIPASKHLSEVLQNGTKLEPNAEGKYEVVVNENVVISLTLVDKHKLTVKSGQTDWVIFQNYTLGNLVIPATEVKFTVQLESVFELEKVFKGTEELTPDASGVYTVVVDADYEISIQYKNLDSELGELYEEQTKLNARLVNGKLNVETNTAENVKAIVDSIVDTGVVNVEVTATTDPNKYTVKLIHTSNPAKTLEKVYEVTVVNFYSITLPLQVSVQAGINIAKVEENTEVILTVNIPADKQLTSFKVNTIEKKDQLVSGKYTFNITQNTTVEVTFELSDEYKASIKDELDKVTTVSVIAPSGVFNTDDVKAKVDTLVDTTVVTTEVREESGTYYLKVSSIKYPELFYEKLITVEIEKVTITIHFGEHANYNGNSEHTLTVNKNAYVKETDLPQAGDITIITSGYLFGGYATKENGDPIVFGTEGINISENTELYVVIITNAVTVTLVAPGVLDESNFNRAIIVAMGGQVANPGDPILPGYKFKHWALSTDLNNPYEFTTNVDNNIELRAIFETNSYLSYELFTSTDELIVSGLIDSTVTKVYIPEKHDDKKVVSIKHRAFHKENIEKLVITGEITEIGTWAFFESMIQEIEFGNHMKRIGDSAFENAKLKSIVIPSTIEYIGAYAFSGCTELETVEFKNENFKAISRSQFINTKYLNNLLSSSTDNLAIVNNVIIAAGTATPNDLVIPATVTHIGEGALSVTGLSLKNLTFEAGSQLVEIGNYAFEYMTLPNNLVIPKSVKQIGFRAFNSAREIVNVSFEDDSALETVRPEAFARTLSLKSYALPTNFTAISKKQFYGSTALDTILNTEKLTYIGEDALSGTKWYKNNSVDSDGNKYKFITFDGKILIADVNSTDDDNIPATVEYISPSAFYRPMRNTLTIPATVKKIYPGAFHGNGLLTTIHISGYIEKIYERAFDFQSEFIDYVKTTVIIDDVDIKPDNWDENWNIVREYDFDKDDRIEFLWSPVCTVSFDVLDGTSSDTILPVQTNKGETVTLPNVTVTHTEKVFVGWEYNGVRFTSATPVNKSITVTAKYIDKISDYDIRFENETIVFVKLNNNTLTTFEVPAQVDGVNVTIIDNNAFADNTVLTTLTLPEEIVSLNDSAFVNCTNLETINLGTKVVNFGKDVFKGTKYLANFHAANNNLIINNVLVDAKTASGEVNFTGISKVTGYAFAENTTITKATFAEGLTHLEAYAFKGATALVAIVLPKGANFVKANAFAIGGSNTVNINCEAVSYIKPRTWENGYDNGDGATLQFVWEPATLYSVTLPDEVTPTDPNVIVATIKEGENIELQIAIKPYQKLIQFLVNGEDKTSEIVDNKYQLLVDENKTITVQYDLEDKYKVRFNKEFDKLKDVMGYYNQRQYDIDSIKDTIGFIVDNDVVSYEVTNNASNYDITLSFKLVPSFSRTKENVVFKSVAKLDNDRVTVISQSAFVNSGEHSSKLFDKNYSSKWCDNSGISEKYVLAELDNLTFVSRFGITHAGIKENDSFNTGEFKILVGKTADTLHEVIFVTNNKDTRTIHTFPGEEIKFIKLVVTHGENMDGGHVARVYELDIFGEDNGAVDVNINYNGGNYKGDTQSTLKHSKNTYLFSYDMLTLTREYYSFDGYFKQGENTKFNFNTKITETINLEAQWKLSPEVELKLDKQFEKLSDTMFITTEETELTTDLVKNHVESLVSTDVVDVIAEKLSANLFKITLNISGKPYLKKAKDYNFYPKKDGEKVNVTFVLNGGEYNSSNDNVVVQMEKGITVPANEVILVTRNNYSFVSWRIDDKPVVITNHLLTGDVTFNALWQISDEIKNEVNNEKEKIAAKVGFPSSHADFTDVSKLAYIKTLVDEGKVSIVIEHKENYEYKVTLTSVTEPTYSIEKTCEIYRLVAANLPDCMEIIDPLKPGHLTIGEKNFIETIIPKGVTVTITSSTGITNIDTYDQDVDFDVELEPEASLVTIEVSYNVENDQVNQELDKLVSELKVSYPFVNPETITEDDILVKVKNQHNLYGMKPTVRSLGNKIFEVTFTCTAEPTLMRKRKVLATGASLIKDKPTAGYGYEEWDYSSETSEHRYHDFFVRNSDGSVNTNSYWQANGQDNDGEAWISIAMPRDLVYSKFKIKVYHGGVIGLDNNTDFAIYYGMGATYYAKYKHRNRLASYTNNDENITELEIDATKIYSTFHLVIVITKGSINDTHQGLLVGMDILSLKPLPQVTFNLDGGNIDGDTGNIVVPIVDNKIAEGFIPNIPVKEGKTFAGWTVGTKPTQHNELANTLFTQNSEEVIAIWE